MMLRFVPESVANAAVATAGSVTAAAPAARVSRLEREGQPMVKLTDGFDRSWRQVGMVLDRSGFTVEDRDRTKGVYFVRYVDPQREARAKGLLDRITGTTSKDLSSSRYQITVKDDVPGTLVGVLTADGKVPASEVDRRIASQIVQVLAEALR